MNNTHFKHLNYLILSSIGYYVLCITLYVYMYIYISPAYSILTCFCMIIFLIFMNAHLNSRWISDSFSAQLTHQFCWNHSSATRSSNWRSNSNARSESFIFILKRADLQEMKWWRCFQKETWEDRWGDRHEHSWGTS